MSWFLPSYGRPAALASMIEAPGGWPPQITVMLNRDDPKWKDYLSIGHGWSPGKGHPFLSFVTIPEGSRCADAHRMISVLSPEAPFYGLLMDDLWPITPGWWEAMEKAAEDRYVVVVAGERNFPLCRTALAFGGALVRCMGSLVPVPVKHNYEDNLWDKIAADFKLLRPLPDYRVEHRHHIYGTAPMDVTYARGSSDIEEDGKIYEAWIKGPEWEALKFRINGFLYDDRRKYGMSL